MLFFIASFARASPISESFEICISAARIVGDFLFCFKCSSHLFQRTTNSFSSRFVGIGKGLVFSSSTDGDGDGDGKLFLASAFKTTSFSLALCGRPPFFPLILLDLRNAFCFFLSISSRRLRKKPPFPFENFDFIFSKSVPPFPYSESTWLSSGNFPTDHWTQSSRM